MIMSSQTETVKSAISISLKIIRMYDWLLDLYVLDFFVDNHWEKLPESWRECFQNLDPQILGDILSGNPTRYVLPLSFLALLKAVRTFSICREYSNKILGSLNGDIDSCGGHPKLKNLFLKHVKVKKRHEISLMANVVTDTASKSACRAVIDFGSGLGHLVRMLAYKNDLHVAGIECQNQLTVEARKLDLELEYTASKHLSPSAMSQLRRPVHFNVELSAHEQLNLLPLPNTMKNYGLIGLHPCGDLGPLLLKHFVNDDSVKFICVVGCCYMKLTNRGYPMSEYVKTLDYHLSYVSREIACHAIEVYVDRLRKGQFEDLKIHAYRAALERILLDHDPKMKHAPVRSIKHSYSLTFQRYCELALEKLVLPLPTCSQTWIQGDEDLKRWRQVVTVYTLRLTLAPLVETVVLLDRVLYVLEHGLSCEIHPVFDPNLSPRNHIIVGRRSRFH